MSEIEFVDLAAQRDALGGRIEEAISAVVDYGAYIMGPEVDELEQLLAFEGGRGHCVTCGSGTDAIQLALMVLGVSPGDRVVVPDFTFAATAEAVCLVGAEPVFADIESGSYNLDPRSAGSAWGLPGPAPVGIITVDLFGQPSVTPELEDLAKEHGAWLVVDAAQSFGSRREDRSGVASGVLATTSFYPSKPLGAYGDGGAVFCDRDDLAEALRSTRNHGADSDRNCFSRVGLNSRLDTLQAAVLLPKLEVLEDEIHMREEVALRYSEAFRGLLTIPETKPDVRSAWAQYTIAVEGRDRFRELLHEAGVPTRVFYAHTVHSQKAYEAFPLVPGGTPVASLASQRVVSLPMHPYLDPMTQDRIIQTALAAVHEMGT